MKILRWSIFIPAALIIAILITFPIDWLVNMLSNDDEQFLGLLSSRYVEDIIVAIVVPMALIYFGSWIAPNHRFRSSIGLSILTVLIFGSLYLFGESIISSWFVFYSRWLAALNILGIAAAILLVKYRWRAQ
jgi:Na+-driven multidrug efflux pump